MNKLISLLLILCGLVLSQQEAMAHAGELDRTGCHREERTDAYHCHSKRDEGNWKFGAVLATTAMVVWLASEWFDHQFGLVGWPLRVSPVIDENLKTGVVAEYPVGDMQHFGVRAASGVDQHGEDFLVDIYWRLDF